MASRSLATKMSRFRVSGQAFGCTVEGDFLGFTFEGFVFNWVDEIVRCTAYAKHCISLLFREHQISYILSVDSWRYFEGTSLLSLQ